ncbi:tetratricopeptide repeat protein [Limnospira platensis]|uniref:tetratricopeptide repeat protein n=1 Tax=Limnospira platensis TaxID=118562 RepID=UPI000B30EA11
MPWKSTQDALFAYQQATRIQPENANAWALRGYALQQLGELQAAKDAIATALNLNPNQPIARQLQVKLETNQQQQLDP